MSGHWWVEKLESQKWEDAQMVIPWPTDWVVTAYVQFAPERGTRDWALQKGWVVSDIAHWCRDNCKGHWHIAQLDHVYFSETEEAMLFLMSHSRLGI
jgi:hypothetical protein